jgi:hypothetical protein
MYPSVAEQLAGFVNGAVVCTLTESADHPVEYRVMVPEAVEVCACISSATLTVIIPTTMPSLSRLAILFSVKLELPKIPIAAD